MTDEVGAPARVEPEPASEARVGRALLEVALLAAAFLALHALAMVVMNLPFRFYGRVLLGGAPNELVWLAGVLVLAWAAAFAVGRVVYDMSFRACFGLTVLVYLFSRNLFLSLVDLQTVADPNSVAAAIPAISLYRTVVLKFLREVILPVGALLLLYGGVPRLQAKANEFTGRMRDVLRAVGSWVKKDPATDTMHGLWLYFVLLLAAIGLDWVLTQGVPEVQTGNEDVVFSNMTIDLVLLLSLAAGIGEEFMFRGILLSYLLYAMGVRKIETRGEWTGASVAVLVQAAFFGLIHAGYGNLAHILAPMALGIVLGVVALRFGLIPAIIVHTMLDVAAFSQEVAAEFPWVTAAVSVVTLSGLFISGVFFLFQYFTWRERQQREAHEAEARRGDEEPHEEQSASQYIGPPPGYA